MENKINSIWYLEKYLEILMINEIENKTQINEIIKAINWLNKIDN